MRFVLLLIATFVFSASACAGEIREFSVPTLERLGNELTRASQSPDRGASDAARKRARETAVAALKGQLFNSRYDYVVLSDPDGKRLLVYALAATPKSDQVVMAGHFRVTVSADGTKAERIDALSKPCSQRSSEDGRGGIMVDSTREQQAGGDPDLHLQSGEEAHLRPHTRWKDVGSRRRQNAGC